MRRFLFSLALILFCTCGCVVSPVAAEVSADHTVGLGVKTHSSAHSPIDAQPLQDWSDNRKKINARVATAAQQVLQALNASQTNVGTAGLAVMRARKYKAEAEAAYNATLKTHGAGVYANYVRAAAERAADAAYSAYLAYRQATASLRSMNVWNRNSQYYKESVETNKKIDDETAKRVLFRTEIHAKEAWLALKIVERNLDKTLAEQKKAWAAKENALKSRQEFEKLLREKKEEAKALAEKEEALSAPKGSEDMPQTTEEPVHEEQEESGAVPVSLPK